ncbi:hypothetical protein QFW77_17705 [Luteimonas sp. RD2P54]|uniref:Uncharacterized protein n=1 Tax=Luteimonas endophytica TaxID=3042023 RepID=A0ABT6JDB0_9GAMM|nr:hypothetical protein [Luteimonas endophytica]MDH5824808.1 hypothetical protein [Luteimonas endophytica]
MPVAPPIAARNQAPAGSSAAAIGRVFLDAPAATVLAEDPPPPAAGTGGTASGQLLLGPGTWTL